jgi:IS5 family transposase
MARSHRVQRRFAKEAEAENQRSSARQVACDMPVAVVECGGCHAAIAYKHDCIACRDIAAARARQWEKLEALGDPLIRLKNEIDWELFRPELARIYTEKERKNAAGRPPLDVVLMFMVVILQRLYNLSDDQTEFHIRDRASFQRFLDLRIENGAPDAKTLWLFKERLKEMGLERDLFFRFELYLREIGLEAKGGQIVDATFVDVPRQRNTREENEVIKNGGMPAGWEDNPHKLAQKDRDAEWVKKGEETHFGFKDHTNVDQEHKLIRDFTVTGASVHDSLMLDDILDTETKAAADETNATTETVEPQSSGVEDAAGSQAAGANVAVAVDSQLSEREGDTEAGESKTAQGRPVFADSAYRSVGQEARLEAQGIPSRIHERPYRNKPLTEEQKEANRKKSSVRVRVEHVYGFFTTSMNRATYIRSIGSARACLTIGLMNLTYNLARFVQIKKVAACAT